MAPLYLGPVKQGAGEILAVPPMPHRASPCKGEEPVTCNEIIACLGYQLDRSHYKR